MIDHCSWLKPLDGLSRQRQQLARCARWPFSTQLTVTWGLRNALESRRRVGALGRTRRGRKCTPQCLRSMRRARHNPSDTLTCSASVFWDH